MKILVIHNTYQEPGGEDTVVAAEERILAGVGHTIVRYRRCNDELRFANPLATVLAGIETVWAPASNRELDRLISRERPEVAHFHNTFPLISPAGYYACQKAGVPVVQTLHNYRLLCPAATFFRDGRVCESCLGRAVPWPGVGHRCYRGSCAATVAVSAMLAAHHALQTWKKKVNIYIALSEFARKEFIRGGFPPERVVVKQNFVPLSPRPKEGAGQFALYVGRLSEEKGVRVLLSAWSKLILSVPLRMAGDGPLRDQAISEIDRRELKQINCVGRVPSEEIFRLMQSARFLVFPSVCFENSPLTIAESFACGLPVIAPCHGAMAEIVADGKTGLHFSSGDSSDLAAKVHWAWTHPEEMNAMGQAARAEYESKYTAERNYQLLMNIYSRAIAEQQN